MEYIKDLSLLYPRWFLNPSSVRLLDCVIRVSYLVFSCSRILARHFAPQTSSSCLADNNDTRFPAHPHYFLLPFLGSGCTSSRVNWTRQEDYPHWQSEPNYHWPLLPQSESWPFLLLLGNVVPYRWSYRQLLSLAFIIMLSCVALGHGNCGEWNVDSDHILAIPKSLYDQNGGSNCNQVCAWMQGPFFRFKSCT